MISIASRCVQLPSAIEMDEFIGADVDERQELVIVLHRASFGFDAANRDFPSSA